MPRKPMLRTLLLRKSAKVGGGEEATAGKAGVGKAKAERAGAEKDVAAKKAE